MKQVLLVEPDSYTASSINSALTNKGLFVTHRNMPRSALNEARRNIYSIIILEVELPGRGGISVCEQLRKERIETPILFLSSNTSVDTIISSLDAGGDGYMTKPFSLRELTARVFALLNRTPITSPRKIQFGNLHIDFDNHIVCINGTNVKLRKREYEILAFLARNKERVYTRTQLNDRTSSNLVEADDNCIDVHISNIRKALSGKGARDVIETVHGVGYKLKSF